MGEMWRQKLHWASVYGEDRCVKLSTCSSHIGLKKEGTHTSVGLRERYVKISGWALLIVARGRSIARVPILLM